MPKCGDFGHLKKNGAPCGFSIPEGKTICAFHSRTPAERHDLAMKGALSASLKHTLPEEFEIGDLQTPNDVKALLVRMLRHVLKKPIERWRSVEARGYLSLFVEMGKIEKLDKLADAVLAAQHGGQSLVFLNQFLDGSMEGRKKIPSRVKALSNEAELSI